MRRLYFLCPDIDSVSNIITELKDKYAITDEKIHVVGKDHQKLEKADIHEASMLQTTDIVLALKRGALAGAVVGLIGGFILLYFPPGNLILSPKIVIFIMLAGIVFGSWVSGMVGISVPGPKMAKYEKAVAAGELLLMLDVDPKYEIAIIENIKNKHAEAYIEGTAIPKSQQDLIQRG